MLTDTIINDDVQYSCLPDDYKIDLDIIERQNCDKVVNAFGKRLIELCQMSGLRIVNGRKLGDSAGQKTCHEWNGSSTVDYMLIEESSFSRVKTFKVQDKLNHLSDRCPISAVINIDVERKQSFKTNKKGIGAPKKMKWDIQTETMFKLRLSNQNVQEELSELCKVQYNSGDQCEEGLSRINSILRKAADIKISKRYKFIKRKKVVRCKPWF